MSFQQYHKMENKSYEFSRYCIRTRQSAFERKEKFWELQSQIGEIHREWLKLEERLAYWGNPTKSPRKGNVWFLSGVFISEAHQKQQHHRLFPHKLVERFLTLQLN